MDATRGGEKGGKGEKKERDECLSVLFLTLTRWLLPMLRYTSAAWRLSGEMWKQGWSAAGHRVWGDEVNPQNDPLPHLHTKGTGSSFWILLINTFIEALSIQGPILGKNFLFPSHPPSLLLLSQSTFFLSLYSILLFPPFLSLHSFCVSFFFFSSVGSVWIRCLAVSMR